jgi:hypothetical protein
MNATHVMPVAMIVLSIGAAMFYGLDGQSIKAAYWIAAAGITVCVTLM